MQQVSKTHGIAAVSVGATLLITLRSAAVSFLHPTRSSSPMYFRSTLVSLANDNFSTTSSPAVPGLYRLMVLRGMRLVKKGIWERSKVFWLFFPMGWAGAATWAWPSNGLRSSAMRKYWLIGRCSRGLGVNLSLRLCSIRGTVAGRSRRVWSSDCRRAW